MTRRRQSSIKSARDRASEKSRLPNDRLAVRVAALEDICADMKRMLDVQFKRTAAIQAHLDHITAKFSGR